MPLNPTTDLFAIEGGNNAASARTIHLTGSASVNSVLGEWASVSNVYSAASSAMTMGSRVIGSDGKRYKLVGSAWTNDPTTDGGINWQDEEPTSSGGGATDLGLTLAGNTLSATSSTGAGASVDLSSLSISASGAAGGVLSGTYPNPGFDTAAFNTASDSWFTSRTVVELTV